MNKKPGTSKDAANKLVKHARQIAQANIADAARAGGELQYIQVSRMFLFHEPLH